MSPDPQTLILSPVAFYLTDDQKFALLLVNASGVMVTDLSVSMVLKLRRRHTSLHQSTLPYLRDSALLVKGVDYQLAATNLGAGYDPTEDGLKVSVRCSILGMNFGVGKKYTCTKILVATSDDFMDRPDFQDPDLNSSEFWELFGNPMPGAACLHDIFLAAVRGGNNVP